MMLIKAQVCHETLESLGLDVEDLIKIGIFTLLFLLQLFVLIFLGIEAFSQSTDFNSIVNSILPLAAGLLASSGQINIDEQIERVKAFVTKILSKLRKEL